MPKHNVPLSGKTLEETMSLDFCPPTDFGEESRSTNSTVAKEED